MSTKQLIRDQTEKATKEKLCPFCGADEFWTPVNDAWQELYFSDDGDPVWGPVEADEPTKEIYCNKCNEKIPKKIWREWF